MFDINKAADNTVEIEGILSEVDLQKSEFEKNGAKEPCIRGSIKVAVDQEINGVMTNLEIPVNIFVSKHSKSGGIHPAWQAYEDMVEGKGYTSIAAGGKENASRIRLTSAKLQENLWPSKSTGEIVSSTRIMGSFCNPVKSDFKPEAIFYGDIVIGSIVDEVDKEGVETGRLLIKGLIPQWGGKVDSINYVVAKPEAVDHIKNYWNQGDTVRIRGIVNYSSKTVEEVEQMGFGENITHKSTVFVNELIITSGSASALDEEISYEVESIQKGLEDRKARMADAKAKAAEKSKTAKKQDDFDLGF